MNEEQIKQYYERIEKLLNGASKETYGFAPEEIRQILRWYEVLQQENQSLKDRIEKVETYVNWHIEAISNDIEDYLDDDPIENKHIIGEFKEDREHWKDVKKIINNQNDLYMDFILNEKEISKK